MKATAYPVAGPLQPFVRSFLIVESDAPVENRVLPDTSIVLAFRLRGQVAHTPQLRQQPVPGAVITGLQKTSRLLAYAQGTATLLVRFRDDGAAAFFREPLHELFAASEPLDSFFRRQELSDVEEQLAASPTDGQRLAIIERFLLTKLRRPEPDPLVRGAVRALRRTQGQGQIRELARSLGTSQDALEKHFRQTIGASPKQFAAILRFRNVLTTHRPGQALTSTAYAAGYFDQSHFIRDFKSFTGTPPREFFKTSVYW